MHSRADWDNLGWSTEDDGAGGFIITRDTDVLCKRCEIAGPWNLRSLSNGELAHRDYAVCRCGELSHVDSVWPGAPRP